MRSIWVQIFLVSGFHGSLPYACELSEYVFCHSPQLIAESFNSSRWLLLRRLRRCVALRLLRYAVFAERIVVDGNEETSANPTGGPPVPKKRQT